MWYRASRVARRTVPDGGVVAGLNTDAAAIAEHRIVRRHITVASVRLCTAASQQPRGVSMGRIAVGATGDVQVAGIATIESGGVIAIGDAIGSDAIGRAVTGLGPGDFVLAIAETAAAGAGVIIEAGLI